jgi:hypothetical protein
MAVRPLVLMPGLKLLQATPAMFKLKWRTRMREEVGTWLSDGALAASALLIAQYPSRKGIASYFRK